MRPRELIAVRTESTMVSSWNEYLCVRNLSDGKAIVEICGYETLSPDEWEWEDEEGNENTLPEKFNGKSVVGVEDGYLVGGDLQCFNEEDRKEYDKEGLEQVLTWIKNRGFDVDSKAKKQINDALEAQT